MAGLEVVRLLGAIGDGVALHLEEVRPNENGIVELRYAVRAAAVA